MGYRKILADKVFDGKRLLEQVVVVVDEEGRVLDLVHPARAEGNIEKADGILIPAFINSHCHIELSHMRDRIPAGMGMIDFLISIVKGRKEFNTGKEEAMEAAEKEMWEKGIAGVGDISNTMDAISLKQKSRIKWQSFIEVINFYDENMEKQIGWPQHITDEHLKCGLPASLVPHAPYSVTGRTMDVINERTTGKLISIHNQESAAEDLLFRSGDGDFIRMYKTFDNPGSPMPVSGKTSLQTWLPRFTNQQTILSVHNTYINEEDILFVKEHEKRYGVQLVYCLCPNANLYIEKKIPPVDLLIKHDCRIVLGTDSYSSNLELSISGEMKTLLKQFPHLDIETVLKWATSNGADVFGWEELGRIEKGKRPGLVLLNENDLSSKRIL
jgi:cytosine/adenosine deaminase-related metal-dependent hydrolase